jgi:dTDP-4-amino-4,6-dideoxygalactose transaminase
VNVIVAPRASAILYDLLVTRADKRPFLLPANICPIVPITFMKAGVGFGLVDVDPATLNLDLHAAQKEFDTGRFGGVLYAHTYGEPSTPVEFFDHVKQHDASSLIIDDRCLCIPDLDAPDSHADVLLYSTGYAKIVDIGSGGYAFVNDDVPYEQHRLPFDARALVDLEAAYKQSIRDSTRFEYCDSDWLETETDLTWESYRSRIASASTPTQAHRDRLNAIYAARLPREIQLPSAYQHWRFNIRVHNQKEIIADIFDSQLFVSSHYASLAGIMSEGHCEHAEDLAGSVINLFNDHHFTPEMAERVCEAIVKGLHART